MKKLSKLVSGLVGLILIGGLVCGSAVSQEIPWSAHRTVRWEDFLGVAPAQAAAQAEAAAIHMTIRWTVSYTVVQDSHTGMWSGSVDAGSIDVTNTMQPRLSWVVPGEETAAVLGHEQGHFDLNEVYARRLTSALAGVRVQGEATAQDAKATLKTTIDAVAARILGAVKVVQERYDAQTAHGTDAQVQSQWIARIRTWLLDPSQVPLQFD